MDIRTVIAGLHCFSIGLLIGTQSVFGANAETKSTRPGRLAEHHHPKDWRFTLPKGDASQGSRPSLPNTNVTTVTKCAVRTIPLADVKLPLSLVRWVRCIRSSISPSR